MPLQRLAAPSFNMDACNTNTMRQVMESTSSPQTVFLFTGEGVHSEDTDISLLKTSSSWPEVLQAVWGKSGAPAFKLFFTVFFARIC